MSVVIPTFHRPDMAVEAVASALAQTIRDIEVIVVVDGLDDATTTALARFDDDRLRVARPRRSIGNAGARNLGVRLARGRWIALLDDDDLWFPDKLEAQIREARRSRSRWPIVSCRLIARADDADFLWPRRRPSGAEPIGDYLFRRRRPTTGEGMVQTSTILAPAELFRRCRFDRRWKRFVDLDWLLRAMSLPGSELVFAGGDAPHSVYRIEDRVRVSTGTGWREDLVWARAHAGMLTPEAYAAFVLTLPAARAARERDWVAFLALPWEAFRRGSPRWPELTYLLGAFLLFRGARDWLARATGGRAAP